MHGDGVDVAVPAPGEEVAGLGWRKVVRLGINVITGD